jgi:hypothetical protein
VTGITASTARQELDRGACPEWASTATEIVMTDIVDLINRAARDPGLLSQAARPNELQAVLGMPACSEGEIVEALKSRVSHAGGKGSALVGDECSDDISSVVHCPANNGS